MIVTKGSSIGSVVPTIGNNNVVSTFCVNKLDGLSVEFELGDNVHHAYFDEAENMARLFISVPCEENMMPALKKFNHVNIEFSIGMLYVNISNNNRPWKTDTKYERMCRLLVYAPKKRGGCLLNRSEVYL